MYVKRSRTLLIAAAVVSLLVHLILAGYVRWPVFDRSPEQERLTRIRILRVARRVPQTPQPTPAPTPIRTPAVRASIVPPAIAARGSKGLAPAKTLAVPAAGTPPPRAKPAPTPAATATASGPCAGHADTDPTVAATPDAADIPPQARASKASGTAAVRVSLDAEARVLQANLTVSSGNAGLDAVAVQMARGASYTPKYVGCKAVAGDYTFTVKFVAW